MNDYYDVSLKEYRLKDLEQYENYTFIKGNLADKELINKIFEDYKPSIVVNLAAQVGDVATTYADTSALERDFGFKPHTSLREGLRKFTEWYKEFYIDNKK